MRGALYFRAKGNHDVDFTKSAPGHLIDFSGNKQRKVVRATFSAELLNGCDTVDKGFLLAQALHEMTTGEARRREMLYRDNVLLDNNLCRYSNQEGGCDRDNCPFLHVGFRRRD